MSDTEVFTVVTEAPQSNGRPRYNTPWYRAVKHQVFLHNVGYYVAASEPTTYLEACRIAGELNELGEVMGS